MPLVREGGGGLRPCVHPIPSADKPLHQLNSHKLYPVPAAFRERRRGIGWSGRRYAETQMGRGIEDSDDQEEDYV